MIIFKAKHIILPQNLSSQFPSTVDEIKNYQITNNNDFITVTRRAELYSKSFIPSAIQLWNDFESEIKDSSSLELKKNIKPL